MSASAAKCNVVVTLSESGRRKAASVLDALRKAGLTSASLLESVGIVTGSVDVAKRAKLSAIAGVESVEVDRTTTIAPPGSDVQ